MPPPPIPTMTVAEQLVAVAELFRAGLIDRQEFDRVKESLILPLHAVRPTTSTSSSRQGGSPSSRRLGSLAQQLRPGNSASGGSADAGGAALPPQHQQPQQSPRQQDNHARTAREQSQFKRQFEQDRAGNVGVSPSAEQIYRFDTEGYLVIPAVLSSDECAVLRDFVAALKLDGGASLDPLERYSYAGPANYLLDHPVLVGLLETIVVGENHNLDVGSRGTTSGEGIAAADMSGYLQSESAYPFRLDGSMAQIKHAGERGNIPHAYPRVGPLFGYSCHNRKIYSGLTRVVWELNAVGVHDQGTLMAPGSHKSNFVTPPSMLKHDSPNMVSYTCPEGSMVIFTEALTHAGGTWRNDAAPRMAIFNAYAPIMAQYHRLNTPKEVIEAMPEVRRSLFRGVWGHGGDGTGDSRKNANTWFDAETNFAW